MKKILLMIAAIAVANPVLAAGKDVALYGSFRPVLNTTTQGDNTTVDVEDALSRFGLKGSTDVEKLGKAYFQGEWSVPIQNSAELERSRLALVGLDTAYGSIVIGKQRPAHYSMIAEYADIFNHGLSPFAYDSAGSPFFVDNAVKYELNKAGVKFQALSRNTGTNKENMHNVGLGYDLAMSGMNLYVAGAYLYQKKDETLLLATDNVKTTSKAATVALTVSDFYVAAVMQDNDLEDKAETEVNVKTIDLSTAYALGSGYKVKAGWFNYNDDIDGAASGDFTGGNLTLENQLADNVRVHIEYLHKDFSEQDDAQQTLNVGLRYDFSASIN